MLLQFQHHGQRMHVRAAIDTGEVKSYILLKLGR